MKLNLKNMFFVLVLILLLFFQIYFFYLETYIALHLCNTLSFVLSDDFFPREFFLFIMYIFFFHNLHYRKNNSKGDILTSSVQPCWKNSVYQNTFVKSEEASTYQELDLSDSAYQNTEIP